MISKDREQRLRTEIVNDAKRIRINVRELIKGKAWELHDLPSWEAYCERFLACLKGLGREDRREAVQAMSAQGVSQASQARALSVSRRTIQKDQGATKEHPVAKVIGMDGKEYRVPTTHDRDLVDSEPHAYVVRFTKYAARLHSMSNEIRAEQTRLEQDQREHALSLLLPDLDRLRNDILALATIEIPDTIGDLG